MQFDKNNVIDIDSSIDEDMLILNSVPIVSKAEGPILKTNQNRTQN